MIINSCRSTVLSACLPPFKIFIMGTGRVRPLIPPRYRYSGSFKALAAALADARDTARMALAPRRSLLGVPSRSISS